MAFREHRAIFNVTSHKTCEEIFEVNNASYFLTIWSSLLPKIRKCVLIGKAGITCNPTNKDSIITESNTSYMLSTNMVGAFLRKRNARNFRCPTAAKELQRFFGRGTYFQGHRRHSATENLDENWTTLDHCREKNATQSIWHWRNMSIFYGTFRSK